jgi:cell cycle arrest protein BUB2
MIVDPELFARLRSKNLSAEIYAFPCPCYHLSHFTLLTPTRLHAAVLTLCACTPPLDQVLQLWDFLLAFGVHLNVLCVIAQLLLMRDEVMNSPRLVALYPVVRLLLKYDNPAAPCASFEPFLPSRLYP